MRWCHKSDASHSTAIIKLSGLLCSFKGPLALITRFRGVSRSQQNPNLCNRCESHLAVGELHPVTVITLDFADSVGFGRIRLESLSQRELPAVRTKLISLLEQRGALVLPAEASPNGVVQACFNAPVRLDDPLRSGFDALNSAFAWIQDEAIATGLNYPLRAAITKGYVEIFGKPNTNSVCPIGHVTFRAPQLLRYASTGQIVADPQVAVELGFSAQPDENAAVIFDQNRTAEAIQNRFPPLPVWSFSFLVSLVELRWLCSQCRVRPWWWQRQAQLRWVSHQCLRRCYHFGRESA